MLFLRCTLLGAVCAMLALPQTASESQVLQKAVSLHRSGNYAGAIEGYQQFLKAHPENAGVRSNLGAALAHEGRFAEAQLSPGPPALPASSRPAAGAAVAGSPPAEIASAAAHAAGHTAGHFWRDFVYQGCN